MPLPKNKLNFFVKNFLRFFGQGDSVSHEPLIRDNFSTQDTEVCFVGSLFEELTKDFTDCSTARVLFLDKTKRIGIKDGELSFAQICSEGCHSGYVKLLLPHNEASSGHTFYSGSDFSNVYSKEMSSEILHIKMLCAMRLDKRIGSATEIIDHQRMAKPETNVHNITVENSTEIGTSIGINCSVWPKEATEWKTRQRKNNWPTKQTIDDLVTLGCYLLPIPHHQSSDPGNEWQLSFAKVEMELFRQLGPHQKTCYLFMEILYQHYIIDLGTLSLHHMKTCFLWMCEQVAADEWQEENTEDVLLSLLDDIILCMLKANIPDYFIPDNNTLDQFNPEHLRSTVETLQTIKDDIIQSRMPHLKLFNRYLIEDYDTIQAALDFNGVTKYTVQNYYSKPSGIFQQIMDIMPSDNTCDTSESEKYILASLGIGLTLVLTNQTTSAISAFSDGIDGMQMLGLLPREWSTRLSSVLVSSLLIETALGVARCHITSVLEHIQELLSSHIKQTQGSEESLLAYAQSACLNVLYSRSYNDCDTVIDCLKALGSANHPLNCILRAAYSKVNKDEHGCKSWLQKFLKFESVILRTLVKIHSSKPTENAASRFEPGVQLIHVANMARQIAKEDKTKLNRVYVTAGMYTDILVYECEYAGGVLQVQAGLLASLMLVTSTQECDTLVVHALDNLTKPITYHQWFLVGFAWYTIKNFKKAKKAFKETLKHNPGHLGASIFGILCDERQGFFLSNRKKNASKSLVTINDSMETNYALNIYSLLGDEDIILLFSVFQIENLADDRNNVLILFFARHLHVKSALHKDRQMNINYSEMTEKLLKTQSNSIKFNSNCALHYLYFLHQSNRLEEFEHQLESFPSSYFDFHCPYLCFHHTEKVLLPDFISEALEHVNVVTVSAELFLLYMKAEFRQVKHLFQKVDLSILDSIPEILTQVEANTSVSIVSRLSESLNLSLAGSILNRQCQYENARSMYINALNRFPGNSPVVYQKIANCEDKLMNQTVAYVLQENFSEAYSIYSYLWASCIPRCSTDCSGILHLSEKLLDMAQEDHRALQLSANYLQYAITQHKEMTGGSILHVSHALAMLAYLEYMLSVKTLDGSEKQKLLQACQQHLLDASESSNSGSLYTHLGNLLVEQERHSEALPYLDKALELGIRIGVYQEEALPHELLSATHQFRVDNYLPIDPVFQILVCFSEGHYRSFVVYASYLMAICKLHSGEDLSSVIETLRSFCEAKDFCEHSVLGLILLNVGNYKEAAVHFEKEIQNGMFHKRKTMMEFMILSKCCFMLQDVCDSEVLEELISEWIFMLESSEKETVVIDSLNLVMYEAVGPVSLGLYLANTLSRCLDMSDSAILNKATEVYAFLQKELGGVDHLVNGMNTNLAILMSEKFSSLQDGPEREAIRQQATEAFIRALSGPETSLTTTKLAYAEFLLNQEKFIEAVEQSKIAAEIAREMIDGMLAQSIEDDEKLSDSDMQMINFYLQKSLAPASNYLIIGYSMLHDFDKVFDVVDTLVTFMQRAQDLEVDPLVYLIKYITDLSKFKNSIDTVVSYYYAVVKRYPASKFIPNIHNSMGCILFAYSKTLTDQIEEAKYIQKAKESFMEALLYDEATMALYADYINFLYNIGEYEAALTCICESDSLPDSAKGSNSYGHDDLNCVDHCIQQLIKSSQSGRYLTDSHFYVQYLRVAVLIALQKEQTFIESEIQVLLEDGEDKNVDCVQLMCNYLTEQIKR